MQMAQKGSHPGQNSILYLPMILMNPSSLRSISISTPDTGRKSESEYYRAYMYRELRSLVLRLDFHTVMSFLGSMQDEHLCQR